MSDLFDITIKKGDEGLQEDRMFEHVASLWRAAVVDNDAVLEMFEAKEAKDRGCLVVKQERRM